jgi:hypothetical protein
MTIRLALLLACLLASGAAPASALPDSLLTPEIAARTLDEHYYYPQAHGLSTLRANVRIASLDSLFASRGLEPPPVEFVWRTPDTRRFIVGTSPATDLRARVVSLLEGRGDIIVPKPLAETLAEYDTQFVRTRGDTILLAASTRDTTVDLQSFRAFIIRPQWRLFRFGAGSSRGGLVVDNEFQQVEDLCVLSRMHVQYGDLSIAVTIDRVPVGRLWLVSRIGYRFKGGTVGATPSSFDIRLDGFRVNEAIPDSLLEE